MLAAVRIPLMVVGLVLAATGVLFVLQGLNVAFAPRSFMTGDPLWIALGALTLAVSLALVVWSRRSG